ncbi:MAG: phosphatase PAP2 family protein [Bacteroidales bacterium]
MIELLDQLDTRLFIFLNSQHNAAGDVFFLWVTEKYSWMFLYLLILGLLAWRYMKLRLEIPPGGQITGIRFHLEKRYLPWLLLAAVFTGLVVAAGDQISVHLFKNVFQRLRPSHEIDLAEIIHLPRRKGGEFGFVSGHATSSFAVAWFTSRIIGLRWFTWLIFLWAVIFSYSRIYIGVHYPGDSLFGALLGIFIAWMFLRIWIALGKEWFPALLPPGLQKS